MRIPGFRFTVPLLVLAVLFCVARGVSAESADLDPPAGAFSRLGLEDGLSHSRIYALLQERVGYLWIGTSNGLNRYDGRSFRVFKNDPDDPASLPHNYVTSLIQDREGFLWVGTNGGGVGRMDPSSGEFTVYSTRQNDPRRRLSDDAVWGLLEDRQGQIWMGTSYGGLCRLSADRQEMTVFRAGETPNGGGLSYDNIWPLLEDRNGDIWVGTDGGGLNRWIPSAGRFVSYRHDPEDPRSLSSDFIFSLHLDREGTLWIGTAGGGLNRFNREDESFISFSRIEGDETSLSNNTVRAVFEDSAGRFWVGTTDGLNLLDRESGRFRRIFHLPSDRRGISHSRIHAIIEDRSGLVWIGTRDGLNRHVQTLFSGMAVTAAEEDIPRRNDIRSILPRSDGSILLGTYQGLFQIDGKGRQETVLDQGIIYALEPRGEEVLVGTDTALLLLSPGGNDQREQWTSRELAKVTVNRIHRDEDGLVWVATEYSGLGRWDPDTDSFLWFTPESATLTRLKGWAVTDIQDYDENRLILGLRGSPLQLLDRKTLRWEEYLVDHQNLQATLLYHQNGRGWWFAPERGGLWFREDGDGTLHYYDEKTGLPSDVVRALQDDSLGNLWITTIRGVARIRPGDGYVTSYGIEDGLAGLIFNPRSLSRDGGGDLFLGSTDGVVRVNPRDVEERSYDPPLHLEVFDDLDLSRNIHHPGEEIILSPGNRIITLRLSAFDFARPRKIRYAYRFGRRESWVEMGNHGEIVFSHLAPGRYTIQFRATNSGGIWMSPPLTLNLRVRYPLLLRWYMILLYAAAAAGSVFLILLQRTRRHRRIIREQEELVAVRTRELVEAKDELEEAIRKKSQFFINLAHETKTPLTFIQNYLDRYIQTHGGDKSLALVKDNVDKLVRDMVNYLDTEKIKRSTDFYDHQQFTDLSSLIGSRRPVYTEAARRKGLELILEYSEGLMLRGDPLALERVVNNLVDNAIKYTPRGRVTLSAQPVEGGVLLSVADTGPGISVDQQKSLCDPFFQLSHTKGHLQGIGMGLYIVSGILASLGTTLEIDSAPGRGSCFQVVFPGPAGPVAGNTTPKKDPDPVGSPEKSDADLRSGGAYPFRIPPPEKPSATGEEAGKKTLLLVDDDTDMLVFLKDSLEGRFNLLFAQGPQELLENLADLPVPDLIVSDIMMDGMDGHELYEQLQRGNWRSVPLIFLSARGESDELLKSFRQGAVDFIAKPFRLPDLVARIESRLSGQERQRQMLLESVQQRISESLQPLRSSGGENQERLNRREQVYRRLSLSPREEEILDRMVRGHASKEIADHLGISVRTVEKHISNLYRKAGVQNRVELVNLVLDPGFREGGEST